MTAITENLRQKFVSIETELNHAHPERRKVIRGLLTALVAKQHFLMIGAGGSGKSFLSRELPRRIRLDAKHPTRYFEVALDETSTPDQVNGPVDIKAMVEHGREQRRTDGMLPDCDFAFLDEFFNANGPVLHSIMPMLNERVLHAAGEVKSIDLWTAVAGTNKLNADRDLAALWDRIHHRHVVSYVEDSDALRAIVKDSIDRRLGRDGRGETFVTLDELKQAHEEAMSLEFPDAVWNAFTNLKEELLSNGIVVGTRRVVEGYAAILATAWLNGHEKVTVGDLSVLEHMFWSLLDDEVKVRNIVLNACNPGEKKAMELTGDLNSLIKEYQEASGLDKTKRNAAAMEIFKNLQKVEGEAAAALKKNEGTGVDDSALQEVLRKSKETRVKIGTEVFGFSEEEALGVKAR